MITHIMYRSEHSTLNKTFYDNSKLSKHAHNYMHVKGKKYKLYRPNPELAQNSYMNQYFPPHSLFLA